MERKKKIFNIYFMPEDKSNQIGLFQDDINFLSLKFIIEYTEITIFFRSVSNKKRQNYFMFLFDLISTFNPFVDTSFIIDQQHLWVN